MFFLYVQVEVYQNVLKLRCWRLVFILYNIFFKKKGGLELVSPSNFLHIFQRKIFLKLCFISWPNSIAWLSLLLEILGNVCIVSICCPVCDVINFEINLSFLIKPFFYITKKSGQKCEYLKKKRALTWNKKHVSSLLKGFQLSEIVLDPSVELYVN